MSKRTFWSNTAIALIPYLRLDRDRASEFEKATAAASVILTSTQKPQRVDEFCSGIELIQGESWESAVERGRLKRTFAGQVSPAVMNEMLAGGLSPGVSGQLADVCILYSDIRARSCSWSRCCGW